MNNNPKKKALEIKRLTITQLKGAAGGCGVTRLTSCDSKGGGTNDSVRFYCKK